ncbi:MAG TPA: hypothetical protein VH496_20210 [Mycobacterium sp.]
MAAAFRACRRRGIIVLASGTAISLTALTGGITPALAEPADQPAITTPVNPPRNQGQLPKPVKVPEAVVAPPSQAGPTPVVIPSSPPAAAQVPQNTPVPAVPKPPPRPASAGIQPPTVTTTVVNTPVPAPEPLKGSDVAPGPDPALTPTSSPSNTLSHEASAGQPSPSTVAAPSAPLSPASSVAAATSTSSLTPTKAQVVEVQHAETLRASQQDVQLAKASAPVEQKPDPAPKAAVEDLRKTISVSHVIIDNRDDINRQVALRDDRDNHVWDQTVRQFDRSWVQYDDHRRPILANPYHDTLRVVYLYENQPRIVYIPPLRRVVLDVIRYAAYSFTAILVNTVGTVINVAIGTFFGGYVPAPYLPPAPPPLLTYDNVPVVVDYHDARYQPFAVQRIVDVGDDAQYGERKVLLDGMTPAWGVWTQTPDGQRQFEIHKTQQFPGLGAPHEGPLPGNYQLRLANDSSSGVSAKSVYFIVADAVIATLALCAAVAFGVSRRRSRVLH